VTAANPRSDVEPLLRTLAPEVLGIVVRRFGDFAASEDAVQEALLAAATQWPDQGLPEHPRAWLIHVAARRMTDQLRSDIARREREAFVVRQEWPFRDPAETEGDPAPDDDDTLALFFMCCHPALTPSSAIALTLRAVGGLTTTEIAHAFLVPEATLAQRISRAKQTIKTSGVPFEIPAGAERDARLASVLHVLYLIFNEGYTASSGDALARVELSDEAIRLTRAIRMLLPNDGEVAGLLALMLLTDARRGARTAANGSLVPLAEQDRRLWDPERITEGTALVEKALPAGYVGPFQLQAAIAAVHAEATRAEDTDWVQIEILYRMLQGIAPSAVVTLNHAVAAAMVDGPKAGLELLEPLLHDEQLLRYHRLHAVRAHLLELDGRADEARAGYALAAGLTTSIAEQRYLNAKATKP
jgi:RNA polymerase sigma factor (sigma-70 family)